MEIKPTKLVRGQGLRRYLAKNADQKYQSNGGIEPEPEIKEDLPLVIFVDFEEEWYTTLWYYSTYGECPRHMDKQQKRTLKLKAQNFVLINNILYKRGLDETFLLCVERNQQQRLLEAFHSEACGGHFSSRVTAFKIL